MLTLTRSWRFSALMKRLQKEFGEVEGGSTKVSTAAKTSGKRKRDKNAAEEEKKPTKKAKAQEDEDDEIEPIVKDEPDVEDGYNGETGDVDTA